jgi:glutathione S-transferase
MNDDAITLYSYEFSPYAAKVRCFLGLKRLDYRTHYVNPLKARADLPIGHQVPVLTIGGEARNDSTPIGLWLDERFPERPLLPEAGPERELLLELDRQVTSRFIPLSFRLLIAFGEPLGVRWRNRKLGARAAGRSRQPTLYARMAAFSTTPPRTSSSGCRAARSWAGETCHPCPTSPPSRCFRFPILRAMRVPTGSSAIRP